MAKIKDLLNKVNSLPQGSVLLDVRTVEEYKTAHLPNSINVPHDTLDQHLDELKQHQYIYIFCRSGKRAQVAHKTLIDNGFDNLICIDDSGIQNLIDSGLI